MSTTIRLSRPVEHDGKTYESIEVDEPTIAAIENFDIARSKGKPDMTAMLEMYCQDSGLPLALMRKLRATDLGALNDFFTPFMRRLAPDTPEPGDKSPPT